MAKLDCRKYAWDVMEHVVRGVRASDTDDETPHTHVVDLGVRRWFGGTFTSSVHLTVVNAEEAGSDTRGDEKPSR